jgi:hypothetical protein
MFLIQPVAAATSQGLEWGVALNDEFTYRFTVIEEGETILDEGVNITVETPPGVIVDSLTNWSQIPAIDIDLAYTNGTALGFEAFYLLGFIVMGGLFAVPTGNFSLLSELLMTSLFWTSNHTIIDDSSRWGARLSGFEGVLTMQIYVHYLKSDGFAEKYVMEGTNGTSGLTTSVTLIRDGVGLDIIGLLQDNILVVGIGVGVIVILGAVVCIRRR